MEWALALLRTPSRRHALRQTGLPADVDRLLAVAGGHASGEALESMVRAFGEPAERLIEAARFYAREVLFFPDADAYRVLGVAADADAERIKLHHRLLQQWLHPDRLGGQDDAVFAARVNVAWNALRNEDRRSAYDKAMAADALPQSALVPMEADAGQIWVPAEGANASARWHQWLPMVALVLVCMVLVWLVLRDMARAPDGPAWKEPQLAGNAAADALSLRAPKPAIGTLPEPVRAKSKPAPIVAAATTPAPMLSRPLPPQPAAAVVERKVADAREDRAASQAGDAPPVAVQRHVARLPAALPRDPPADAEPPAPTSAPLADAADAGRLRLASQTGQALVRYMDNPLLPPPPIWNSPAMQSSADGLRRELQAIGDGQLENIRWRFDHDAAVLTADYRMTDGASGQVRARLVANITWREQQWLVTGVGMVKPQ